MSAAVDPNPGSGVLVIPSGGGSLPTAAGANEVPASTGAGTTYTAVTVPALLASVSNTRGRILRRGASAWEALDASTADTFVGGDGTDVTTRTAAQVRASILGPFADAMTGSGWTALSASGGASASWASGPARLLLNCAPGSAGSCGAGSTTRLPSTDTYDVAIRVRFDVGDGSANGRILFVVGRDSANCLVLTLSAAGALQAGRTVGGSYAGYTVLYDAGINSNARTGGQLWVRASRSPQGFVWLWGIGAGGQLPTEWVEYWASVPLSASVGYSYTVVAHGLSQGPFVGISLVTVSAIDVDASVLDLVTGLPGAFGGA